MSLDKSYEYTPGILGNLPARTFLNKPSIVSDLKGGFKATVSYITHPKLHISLL